MSSLNTTIVRVVSAGLTTATVPYSANDQIGTLFTVPMGSATGIIESVSLVDKASVIGPVNLWLYDRSVTTPGNNAADTSVTGADGFFLIGPPITLPPPDSKGNFRVSGVDSLGYPWLTNGGSPFNLYVQIVALSTLSGAGFFATVNDIQLTFGIVRDV